MWDLPTLKRLNNEYEQKLKLESGEDHREQNRPISAAQPQITKQPQTNLNLPKTA